ncbi:MAG: hypothetical protein B0W54_02520 [Cellvibrio sp. 79]|nr:MAG: hypothetical protein B0W54_02520 [Cellvibrio sp. 79]
MNLIKNLLAAATIFSSVFYASSAMAYIKITYEGTYLPWESEHTEYGDWGEPSSFFQSDSAYVEATFIIPDFHVPLDEWQYVEFKNPAVDVKSNFFNSLTIDPESYIGFSYYPGNTNSNFYISLAFTETNTPTPGASRHGSFKTNGMFTEGYSDVITRQEEYTLTQNNWILENEFDETIIPSTVATFFNTTTDARLTIERFTVPEPLSPLLLLSGLAGIFIARRMNTKTIR